MFIVATKVDECKLSEEGVEKKTEQIIQSFGTTPYKVLTCKNYLYGDTVPDIVKDISIITFLKKVHYLKRPKVHVTRQLLEILKLQNRMS